MGVFLLTALALITRFWNLSFPSSVVFDEAHFGLYATKYLSGQYYFDIHPPLGKMIFAVFAVFAGAKPGFEFVPNAPYGGDFPFFGLRFAAALFGVLLIPLVYFLVRALGFSRRSAFLAGFLLLFDNAVLAQSRFILLDIFLVFFTIFALFLFFLFKKTQRYSRQWHVLGICAGVAFGLAFSVKLIGLGALALIWFWQIFQEKIYREQIKHIVLKCVFFLAIPILTYSLIFFVHLALLPNSCVEGCGYVLSKEHSQGFASASPENPFRNPNSRPPGNIFQNFFAENHLVELANIQTTGGAHYYESKWYSWPFMIRPIAYANFPQEDKTSSILFVGNPVVWWSSFLGVLAALYFIFRGYFYKTVSKIPPVLRSLNMQFLVFGYVIFFLSFAAVSRFLFLYHYLLALVFSVIIFSVFIDSMLSRISTPKARVAYGAILLLVFFVFLYFAPLTYGIPLTKTQFNSRMWLPTWNF